MPELRLPIAMARIIRADEAVAFQDGYRFRDAARVEAERSRRDAVAAFADERRRGLQEGRQAGAAEAARLLGDAEHAVSRSLADLEQSVVLLAVDLAERILGASDDRTAVVRAATRAIEDMRAEEDGVLYAAPQHLKALGERMAALAADRPGGLAVEPDLSAGPRDCSLMTARGVINLGVQAQLDALRAGILAWYRDGGDR
ncbi:MAG TPA: FliH/SctL family protein [Actinocrinis sp.]|nr:FliH/SctL family protein [Actinocrinis sp.]